MPTEAHGQVTSLLERVAAGNDEAKKALFAHVYDQLREKAHARMRVERRNHTWGTTGLVHEVYFQLLKGQKVFTKNRAYFFAAAARAMHQLLRAHARGRKRRPEGHIDPEGRLLLDEVVEVMESTFEVPLPHLMSALDRLKETGKHGPRRYDTVQLRIWGGLTYEEIADALGVCVATVERDWLAARAWLHGQLKGRGTDD